MSHNLSQISGSVSSSAQEDSEIDNIEEEEGKGVTSASVTLSKISSTDIQHRPYFEDLSNHLKIGILGTTNVGKSSLFNLLTRSKTTYSAVENSPFTTIDPFIATFTPQDDRMDYFQKCNPTASTKPARITVIDTAGLIPNSVRDRQGVGADSLEAVQYADALIILLKCFDSPDMATYEPVYDPLRDLQMIELELLQRDLIRVENLIMEIEAFINDVPTAEHLQFQYALLLRLWESIAGEPRPIPPKRSTSRKIPLQNSYRTRLPRYCQGKLVRLSAWDGRDREAIANYKLLTTKEMVYVTNMTDLDYNRRERRIFPIFDTITTYLRERRDPSCVVPLSIAFEQRLFDVDQQEGQLAEYLAINGTHKSGLPNLLENVYATLKVIHYYTVNEDVIQCWVLRRGMSIVDAAAKKDVNIARYFIRGDVIPYDEYTTYEGDRLKLQMDGKIAAEGRRYVVNDGDILEYLHHPYPSPF